MLKFCDQDLVGYILVFTNKTGNKRSSYGQDCKSEGLFQNYFCECFTMYRFVVLQPGYSIIEDDGSMRANGTSTLVVNNTSPCGICHSR